jgi:hypothetical protein
MTTHNQKTANKGAGFWVWALCLFAFGSIPVAALLLWGPWIAAALVVGAYAAWRGIPWLIERGGAWATVAFVAYQIVGFAACAALIVFAAGKLLK